MKKFSHVLLTIAFWFTLCMNGLALLYAGLINMLLGAIKKAADETKGNMSDGALNTVTVMAAVTMAFVAGVVFAGWMFAGYWELMHTVTITPVVIE